MTKINLSKYLTTTTNQELTNDVDNIRTNIDKKLTSELSTAKRFNKKILNSLKKQYLKDKIKEQLVTKMVNQKKDEINHTSILGSIFNPVHHKLRQNAMKSYNSELTLLNSCHKETVSSLDCYKIMVESINTSKKNKNTCLHNSKQCIKELSNRISQLN